MPNELNKCKNEIRLLLGITVSHIFVFFTLLPCLFPIGYSLSAIPYWLVPIGKITYQSPSHLGLKDKDDLALAEDGSITLSVVAQRKVAKLSAMGDRLPKET